VNKIAVIVPFFQRHDVTTLCFERLARQQIAFGLTVYTAGSEGEKSKSLAESFGFNYVEVENLPVSNKNNVLLQSTRSGNFDGVIIVGSDDFLSDSIFEFYSTIDCEKVAMYGFNNLHFYDTKHQIVSSDGKYKDGIITIGAGRLFTKALLEEMDYYLWRGSISRGLDTLCSNSIPKGSEVFLNYDGHLILDVKHEINISSRTIVWSGIKRYPLSFITDSLKDVGEQILGLRPRNEKSGVIMKLEFERDYSPRKKGEVVDFQSREEIQIAEWYLANGIAKVYEECNCDDKTKKPCIPCEEAAAKAKAEAQSVEAVEETTEVVEKTAPAPRKRRSTKK